jgi:hypothetical protein
MISEVNTNYLITKTSRIYIITVRYEVISNQGMDYL